MVQHGRIENFIRSLGPRVLNQIILGTDRRHVTRMSHDITYIWPLKEVGRIIQIQWFDGTNYKLDGSNHGGISGVDL